MSVDVRAGGHEGRGFDLRPVQCPICRIDATKFVGLRGGEYHRDRLGIATRIVRCRRCGLLYANPFPFPRDPSELYGDPAKYFERHAEDRKITRYQRLVQEARRRLTGDLSSILDVGSGRGELLAAAKREGVVDTVGLEFAEHMIRYARDTHGVVVLASTIEDYARRADRVFDLIVLNAVLEHVYDPDAMIESAARLTRPGSLLYIDVPQDPNLVTRLGNGLNRLRGSRAVFNLSPTWPPYHVFGFTRHSLGILLRKHGFAIESIRISGNPVPRAGSRMRDRAMVRAGRLLGTLARLTGTASNMFVWARREGQSSSSSMRCIVSSSRPK